MVAKVNSRRAATFDILVGMCQEDVPALQHDRGPILVAITAVIMILATIAVILRLVSQTYSRSKFHVSDYLMIVSLVSCLKG